MNVWPRLVSLGFWARCLAALPLLIPMRLASTRLEIEADVAAWMEVARRDDWPWTPDCRSPILQVLYVLGVERPFRSLFWYRIAAAGGLAQLASLPLRPVFRGESALYLYCDRIGTGLYLPHAFATILSWRSVIGSNCRIYQNVTVGWGSDGAAPTIGDDITIYTGAILIGGITVGDGAVIGAGALVNRDVPAGTTVAGVPARVIASVT